MVLWDMMVVATGPAHGQQSLRHGVTWSSLLLYDKMACAGLYLLLQLV